MKTRSNLRVQQEGKRRGIKRVIVGRHMSAAKSRGSSVSRRYLSGGKAEPVSTVPAVEETVGTSVHTSSLQPQETEKTAENVFFKVNLLSDFRFSDPMN